MGAGQNAYLAAYRAYFIESTAVRTNLLVGNHAADNVLLDIMQELGDFLCLVRILGKEFLHGLSIDSGDVFIAVQLVRIADSSVEASLSEIADGLLHFSGNLEELNLTLLLAYLSNDTALELNDALDFLVTEEDGFEDYFLRQLVRTGLNHHDGIVGAGNGQVKVRLGTLLYGRIDDELTIYTADLYAGDGAIERDIGNTEGAGCTYHGSNFRSVVLLYGEDGSDDIYIIAEALREKRTNRAVDKTGPQNSAVAGTTFTLDEAAGNLAYGVHFFFIVNGKGEEVNAFARLLGCYSTDENNGLTVANEDGTV